MSKKFRSPFRELIAGMAPEDTIRIGDSEPLTKKEALKAIREEEARFEEFVKIINKKPGATNTGPAPKTPKGRRA